MEAPWAYHYAGRPDRTTEVVRAVLDGAFGIGRGGLPGNDDSGGLSSWYVWASLGLFPVAGQSLFLVNAPSFDRSTHPGHRRRLRHRDRGPPRRPSPATRRSTCSRCRSTAQPLERTLDHRPRAAPRRPPGRSTLGPAPSAWGTRRRPPSGPSRPVAELRAEPIADTRPVERSIEASCRCSLNADRARDRGPRRSGHLRPLGRGPQPGRGRARCAASTTSASSPGRSRR